MGILILFYLLPLQDFGIYLSTTRVDLAFAWGSLLVVYLYSTRQLSVKPSLILVYLAIVLISLMQLFFRDLPVHRFVSSVISLSVLYFTLFAIPAKYLISPTNVARLLNLTAALGSIWIIAETLFFDVRPDFLFDEPSTAGLFLTAAACSHLLCVLVSRKFKSSDVRFLVLVSSAAVLTLSIHVLTSLLLLISLYLYLIEVRITSRFKITTILFAFALASIFVCFMLINFQHVHSRLSFGGDLNLSQLAFIQGFLQFRHILLVSPLFGTGPGSVGFYDVIDSQTAALLGNLGFSSLNLLDGYCGFFRLFIELGAIPFVLFAYAYASILKRVKQSLVSANDYPHLIPNLYCFTFGSLLLLGIMVREPSWTASLPLPSLFLIFIIPKSSLLRSLGPKLTAV